MYRDTRKSLKPWLYKMLTNRVKIESHGISRHIPATMFSLDKVKYKVDDIVYFLFLFLFLFLFYV